MKRTPRDTLEADQRPKCCWCGERSLELIEERPHPLFGILGVSQQTFRCNRPTCAKLTLD
jgi:hypothetical protein